MAKNSLLLQQHYSFTLPPLLITLLLLLHLILSLAPANSSSYQKQPSQVVESLFEEKTRLGSTPPSCHNKCNLCHPCMAVQVPTLPSRSRVQPGHHRVMPLDYYDQPPASSVGNRYSNYKPLGWKCRCGGHFYNP